MRKKFMPRKSRPFIGLGTLIALLALLWLSGCAAPSAPPPPAQARSVQIPPLPSFARQPTRPPECWPSCETALMRERASWLGLLTTPTQQVPPASGGTTTPIKP